MTRRTTPAPAVLAGGVRRFDEPTDAVAHRLAVLLGSAAVGTVRGRDDALFAFRIEPSDEHATAADGSRVRLLAVHVEGSRVGYAADLRTALAMVAQAAGAERVELPPAPVIASDVTCPICSAAPGAPCRSNSSTLVVHAARTHVAASPRDRAVDSAGTAALAEEVARLRERLRSTEADLAERLRQIERERGHLREVERKRDALRTEAERLRIERDEEHEQRVHNAARFLEAEADVITLTRERDEARRERDEARAALAERTAERDEVTAELDRLTAIVAEYATRETSGDVYARTVARVREIAETHDDSASVQLISWTHAHDSGRNDTLEWRIYSARLIEQWTCATADEAIASYEDALTADGEAAR